MYCSQFMQDRIINELFIKNQREGFFVDVGAHDGVTYSNSHFFEKELGWNGICVEPLPNEFEKLNRNRSSINVNACAFSNDGSVTFSAVEDKQSTSIHSYDMLSGIARHHNTADRVAKFGLKTTAMEIKSVRLQTIFNDHGVDRVDYLSIDTEGSELEVLMGIDFGRVHINLIDVEHNYQRQRFEVIARLLQESGFRFVQHIACDALFVNVAPKWAWQSNHAKS